MVSDEVASQSRDRAATGEDMPDGSPVSVGPMRALGTAIVDLHHAVDRDEAVWKCVDVVATALPASQAVAVLAGPDGEWHVAAAHGIDGCPRGPLTPRSLDAWLDRAFGTGRIAVELPAPSRGVLAATPASGTEARAGLRFALTLLAATLATTLEALARDRRVAAAAAAPSQPGSPRSEALRLAHKGFSHDVRSPLQAVMMQAALLESGSLGELTPEQQAVLQDMREGLGAIREAARTALEAGRVLAGELELSPAPLRIDDVVADVLTFARSGVEARGHRLENRTGADLTVNADAAAVARILYALLDNAAKFCPRGGHIVLEARTRAADASLVDVSVHDNGPGVPEELADRVFDPYVRASRGNGVPGTGLGLTLARGLARAMGGDLVLASRGGRLACFTLSLPAA